MTAKAIEASTGTTLPEELPSAEAKLVYLYLRTAGGGTADDLAAALEMGKLSLFPVLDALADRGLVRREGDTYRPRPV